MSFLVSDPFAMPTYIRNAHRYGCSSIQKRSAPLKQEPTAPVRQDQARAAPSVRYTRAIMLYIFYSVGHNAPVSSVLSSGSQCLLYSVYGVSKCDDLNET